MLTPLTLDNNGQIVVDETYRAAYRRLLAREYATIWRAHPDVLKMHKQNRQFVTIEGVVAFEAARHTVAQALRAEVVADLLGLPNDQTHKLVAGTLLTDSFKAEERRYMKAHGFSLESYNVAQQLAHEAWQKAGFDPEVIEIAGSVAHESLVSMEILCALQPYQLTPQQVLCLIAHYLDDISVGWEWCRPALGNKNMLDFRMEANAANPAYQEMNKVGGAWLRAQAQQAARRGFKAAQQLFNDNKTLYEYQAMTGRRVERRLWQLLQANSAFTASQPRLPEFIDSILLRRFNRILAGG